MTSSTTTSSIRGEASPRLLVTAVVFFLAATATMAAQEMFTLSRGAAAAVALVPATAFLFFILEEVRMIRRLDELNQRIQLEALGIGFPLAMLLFMSLGFLQRAGFLPNEDLRDLWGILPLCYFIGLAIARKRYL